MKSVLKFIQSMDISQYCWFWLGVAVYSPTLWPLAGCFVLIILDIVVSVSLLEME